MSYYYCELSLLHPTVPAAPRNVTVVTPAITPTTILVTWDPPFPIYGDIISYSVRYSFVDSDNLRINNITDLNITLSGLMEYTIYTIVVFAFTDKGRGELSEPIVIRTAEHSKD